MTQLRQLAGNPLRGIDHWCGIAYRPTLSWLRGWGIIIQAPLLGQHDIPAGVIIGRQGFAHPRRTITQPDIALPLTRRTKLRKAPVFLGHHKVFEGYQYLLIHSYTV
jgi:hypothetical protein